MPGQTFGVVVAMESEERHLLALADAVERVPDRVRIVHQIVVDGQPCVVVRSGIGLIPAAAATEWLVQQSDPAAILNFGCAGAHRRDLMPGDVVIGSAVAYPASLHLLHDGTEQYNGFHYEIGGIEARVPELPCDPALVDLALRADRAALQPWPPALGWPASVPHRDPTVTSGVVASADMWTQAHDRLDLLGARHASLCEDMEAAAIALVAAIHGRPFLTVKDISNNEYLRQTDLQGFSDFPVAEVGKRAAVLLAGVIGSWRGQSA